MSKKIHVRPGRGQSKVGFGVGIIFCLLGVVVVIPTFGLFGVFWTAVAGWIAYSHYRNGFTDKPIADRVIEIEDDGDSATVIIFYLMELHQLFENFGKVDFDSDG